MNKPIVVGVVGAGRGADLEMSALVKVYGVPFRLKTLVARRKEQMEAFTKKFGFEQFTSSYDEMLADPEIDVVCICTPPYTHREMILQAMKAGKHVICEKPIHGFFGGEGAADPVGETPKSEMFRQVLDGINEIRDLSLATGKKLMYAENAVYAPSIQKTAQVIRAKNSRILYMKGEESLNGSTSLTSYEWSMTGGGSLTRNGTHPLTAMLWLKYQEAENLGKKVWVESVLSDTGRVTPSLSEAEHRHLYARPHDVEDTCTTLVTFSDGSKMLVVATNVYINGLRDYVDVYCNDAVFQDKLTLTDTMSTYFLDEDGLDDIELMYLGSSKIGWTNALVSDEVIRGYTNEMQDFMEAIYFDREPMSGIQLAYDTMRLIYATYLSAEQGRRIYLDEVEVQK